MGKAKGVVHVVGTGTIGEPLIGLLCSFKDQAGFSEVTFHKRSPLPRDLPKLKALGVEEVFGPGASTDTIVARVRQAAVEHTPKAKT